MQDDDDDNDDSCFNVFDWTGKNTQSSVNCVLQKCAEYWPEEDSVTHEGIEITIVTVTQEDDYSLRVFTLKVRHRKRVLTVILMCQHLP